MPLSPIVVLARTGYGARGVVYAIVGAFAILAAIAGASPRSPESAVLSLLDEPLGKALVTMIAFGLAAFALWRLAQGAIDADDHGAGMKGLVIRAGLLVSAFTHAALAVSIGAVAFRLGQPNGNGANGLMQGAIGFLGARPVATLLAVIFLGVAAAHFVRAWRGSFERFFIVGEDQMRVVRPIGRLGLSARGIVFLVIGGLMAFRAWTATDMEKTPPNLVEVLRAVQSMPSGPLLLGLIGAGLVLFALYSLAAAAYRTVDRRPLSSPSVRDRVVARSLSPLQPTRGRPRL